MRLRPVAIEKIAVLRATARPLVRGGGAASPSAAACPCALAVAVGSGDTGGVLPAAVAATAAGAPAARRPATLHRRRMANIHSQKKRIQRAERERLENRRYTSTIKTYFRRLQAAVAGGDAEAADAEHRELVRTIDKAVKRGALHRNAGARKKSRAAKVRAGTGAGESR